MSLNVDSLIVNDEKELIVAKRKDNISFGTIGASNGIPLYFINGNISKRSYLNFGIQSIAKQIIVLSRSFTSFRTIERNKVHDVNSIIKKDKSWIARFFYMPVLIVRASIDEHELAMRYILNQRKRNFAFKKKHETPVYIVSKNCTLKDKSYLSGLESISVKPLIFHSYSAFWKLISEYKR